MAAPNLPFNADELNSNAYQVWNYTARQFLKENRIDLTPYLDATNWAYTDINLNVRATRPTLYRNLDGTLDIRATSVWISPNVNPTAPVVVFNLNQIPNANELFKDFSTSTVVGNAFIQNADNFIVLGQNITFDAGGNVLNLNVWNLPSATVTFQLGNQFYFNIKLYPFFDGE